MRHRQNFRALTCQAQLGCFSYVSFASHPPDPKLGPRCGGGTVQFEFGASQLIRLHMKHRYTMSCEYMLLLKANLIRYLFGQCVMSQLEMSLMD